MRITEPPLPVKSVPDGLHAIVETPLPAEMPVEVHAGFSLAQLLERSVKTMNRNLEGMLKCPAGVPRELQGSPAEVLAQSFSSAEFFEQIHAKRIRSLMWTHQMRQSGTVFNLCLDTLPMEQRQQIHDGKDRIFDGLRQTSIPDEIADEFEQSVNASNEFFDKLLELIGLIKNGYLAVYEHIIAAYSNFFSDFNTAITAKLKDWIEGANEGKEVKFDAGALKAALTELIAKYSHPGSASVLFPQPGDGGTSRAEAEKWREALGLPPGCLKRNADGSYCVVIDTGPLWRMRDYLPSGRVTWDTAKFQAWQTGFNAQEEQMKNTLQSFTQKYSNANAYHDNFNKTLSSHLTQLADMLTAMLNF